MGKYSYSGKNNLEVDLDFELDSIDLAGNERTPISDISGIFVAERTETTTGNLDITGVSVEPITNYTFDDAIENFTGTFRQAVSPGEEFFDFAPAQVPLEVEDPNLDLTARYLPENTLLALADGTPTIGFNSNGDTVENDEIILDQDRIEYIFSSPELEEKGISEVALFVEDFDNFEQNGTSVFDTLKDVQSNLILDTPEERIAATTDIDSIANVINSAALNSELIVRVSAKSANSDAIRSETSNFDRPQQTILEAEDFNNLGDYKVVNFPAVEGKVISLLGADGKTSVPTATATSGSLNLGTLDQDGDQRYDVNISYFDERDGKGQIDILLNDQNGVVKDVRTIKLDQATSSDLPNEDIRRPFLIDNLEILPGDTISIRGIANGGEQARVDYISFADDSFSDQLIPDPTTDILP